MSNNSLAFPSTSVDDGDIALNPTNSHNATEQWLGNSLAGIFMSNDSVSYIQFTNSTYDYHPCDPDSSHFNCTRERYLEYRQGPQQLPLQQALLVTIIFGGIFLTSIVGNVLVCVVIIRHSTLHTATNYYLFSLAVSDLLYLLFGLPSEIVIFWHQYPYLFGLPFCKIRAFISEASTYVSVLTIVAFSMERFLAICHPLHLYAMSGFKRALRIIAILWIVSFISAIPFGLLSGIHYEHYPLDNTIIWESAFCSMPTPKDFPLFELSFCIFFIIPMLLIIILYGRMGIQIRSRAMQQLGVQQGSMHKESRHQQSRRAVIRMLAAVVITFFVCWLPFHIQRLFFRYAQDYQYFQEINEIMFSITGFAYYVSCTINPILYNVMSHRYRVAFKDILCGKKKSAFYNNGFLREQSSFRETIASSLGTGSNGRSHSIRARSVRHMKNIKEDRDSVKSNNVHWQKKKPELEIATQKQEIIDDPPQSVTNVVVVDNGLNGRPKVYTEDEAVQENLIKNSNETCI